MSLRALHQRKSTLFLEAARIILDGRSQSNSWMQCGEARNAEAAAPKKTSDPQNEKPQVQKADLSYSLIQYVLVIPDVAELMERSLQAEKLRVAFQGETGAFSEAAAVQLLGEDIITVPRPTFDATFRAISEGAADAVLVPVENSLAGSVVRVYDLLLDSALSITAETILPIEMNLIACPGASIADIRSISSHPMALAQCERFFAQHPSIKRQPAEDTAGSVREALARGDKTCAAIAGRYAAERYRGVIIAEKIQDNAENFTRFVLLQPGEAAASASAPEARKMSIAMRLAHRPGSLLSSLEPFARNGVNLLKIESRPIHGRPWEYQFFIDVEAATVARLEQALGEVREAAHEVRVLGLYRAAQVRS